MRCRGTQTTAASTRVWNDVQERSRPPPKRSSGSTLSYTQETPTEKSLRIVDRISSGKIEEEWVHYDTFHLMQQIGALLQQTEE